ncbi:MAG: type II toxin-antitoxin system Phd/YefM family antitoxin [Campylobacterota bacterium]|nr:type II toxin-antitoxin system Phd/YefM family antitoxin [Campylobacterota bacterium]
MVSLNPKILEKNGKKQFVILTYEEFSKIRKELEDYEDLCLFRETKQREAEASTISLKEAKKKLNLD